jgi:hypothetical protein
MHGAMARTKAQPELTQHVAAEQKIRVRHVVLS